MNGRFRLLSVAKVSILATAFLALGTIRARSADNQTDHFDPKANEDCDRSCLNVDIDQVLAAMVAHDSSRAPLARDVKYTENGQILALSDGFWGTASALPSYKVYIDDPLAGQAGFFGVPQENGAPVILSLRLKVVLKKITQIEAIIIRKEASPTARPDQLTDKPVFAEVVPPAERSSRQNMIAIANSYFSAIENDSGKEIIPFDNNVVRIENGVQTCPNNANVIPNSASGTNAGAAPPPAGPQAGCADQINLGNFREDTLLRDRRYEVIDEERGLVLSFLFFDHNATVRSWQLTDGRTRKASRTAPWTWEIAELFKMRNGKILQVESLVNAVPYGMKSGW